MTTNLFILGWKVSGLRVPDHEVSFERKTDDVFPVSLIQMPNGTGKTTTLELLRAALSGSLNQSTTLLNHEARKFLIESFQKKDSNENLGYFAVHLIYNNRRLTIEMNFDFAFGQVNYKTTYLPDGQCDGFDPPFELTKFLKPDFVKFFVFDGELAESLSNPKQTNAQSAIEYLSQINLFKTMGKKISGYWNDKTEKELRIKKEQTLHTEALINWQNRLEEVQEELKNMNEKKVILTNDLNKQETLFEEEIKKSASIEKKIKTAESDVNLAESNVNDISKVILDKMRDPHNLSTQFLNSMLDLKNGLDKVKLPESAAREFFNELKDEKLCVCGRPIDEKIREEIIKRAELYLDTDDVNFLNSMKTSITEALDTSAEEPIAEKLPELNKELEMKIAERQQAKNILDSLLEEASQENPTIQDAKENIEKIKKELYDIDYLIDQCNDIAEDHFEINRNLFKNINVKSIRSISALKSGIKILEDDIEEMVSIGNLKQKRDILTNIFDEIYDAANSEIREKIKDNTNNQINELLPHNKISIKEIRQCLVLHGQEEGSVGETLAVGYAFLSTLFTFSDEHKLPFIVDSPANPMDNSIRRNIGKLVPSLSNQFIAFVISSEREAFVDSLQESAFDDIQYITIFRDDNSELVSSIQESQNFEKTADGYISLDQVFFENFQVHEQKE